jgi:hypothetical protein
VQWSEVEDQVAQAIAIEIGFMIDERMARRLARAAIREMNAIHLRDVILGD